MIEKLDFTNVPQVVKMIEVDGKIVGVGATSHGFVPLAVLVSAVPVAQPVAKSAVKKTYTGKPRGRKPKMQATNGSGASVDASVSAV